jgi:hypothetical protein
VGNGFSRPWTGREALFARRAREARSGLHRASLARSGMPRKRESTGRVFFHKIQNHVIRVLKFKVLLLIPVVPVRTEPPLDWELTRIPEEVLDRLSSIFTIWYM